MKDYNSYDYRTFASKTTLPRAALDEPRGQQLLNTCLANVLPITSSSTLIQKTRAYCSSISKRTFEVDIHFEEQRNRFTTAEELFFWLWFSILDTRINHSDANTTIYPPTSSRDLSADDLTRRICDGKILMRLRTGLNFTERFWLRPKPSMLIGDRGSLNKMIRYLNSINTSAKFGTMCIGFEDCHTPCLYGAERNLSSFNFRVFRDCTKVDQDVTMKWPIGPYSLLGFPVVIAQNRQLSFRERDMWVFSPSVAHGAKLKPTRVQAYLVCRDICSRRHWNCQCLYGDWAAALLKNLAFHHISGLTTGLENVVRKYRQAVNPYLDRLLRAKFTLAPRGYHPETYRAWEIILAGSIPVIEETTDEYRSEDFLPLYGPSSCTHFYSWLHDTNAPVLWVKDWKELDEVLEPFVRDEEYGMKFQMRFFEWRAKLVEMLRNTVERQILEKLFDVRL